MTEAEIESRVASFRKNYPDYTAEEEARYRDYITGGTSNFVMRCTVQHWPAGCAVPATGAMPSAARNARRCITLPHP